MDGTFLIIRVLPSTTLTAGIRVFCRVFLKSDPKPATTAQATR